MLIEPAEGATPGEMRPAPELSAPPAAGPSEKITTPPIEKVTPPPVRKPGCSPPEACDKVTGVLQKIQALRGRRLFLLAVAGNIDDETYEEVCSWRNELKEAGSDEKLDVLIHSGGGGLSTCYQIARLLARSANAWEALVPGLAPSGATLISLGSARIVISEVAQLGPIDPQVISKKHEKFFASERQSPLEAFQALTYLRRVALGSLDATMAFLMNEKNVAPKLALETSSHFALQIVQPILARIDPYDIGAFSLDANLAVHYCERIANPADPQKKTQRKVKVRDLVEKYPAHEFVIDLEEAKALDFNVVEPPADLDAAFDEARGPLNEVEQYIGFVPPMEPKP